MAIKNYVTHAERGTVAAPGHSYRLDTGSGMYSPAAGQTALAANGVQALLGTTDGVTVPRTLTASKLASGAVLMGSTASSFLTNGFHVNQGANDDHAHEWASSDVAHGVTALADTDVFGSVQKIAAASGGLRIDGYSEDEAGVQLHASYTTDNTTKTASANGAIQLVAGKKSGTSVGAPGANANVLVVKGTNANTTRFIVDYDGDLHADGGTSSSTMVTQYDEYDDVALVRTATLVEAARGAVGVLRDEFDEMLRYSEQTLVDAGLLGAPRSEGGLWNITGMQRLHSGAIWQIGKRLVAIERRLEALGV